MVRWPQALGPAKDHLVKDRQHWLALRSDACVGTKDDVIAASSGTTARASITCGLFGDAFIPSSASRRW